MIIVILGFVFIAVVSVFGTIDMIRQINKIKDD
jgi:hypothetical protein